MNLRAQTQNIFLIIDFIWLSDQIRDVLVAFFSPNILVKYELVGWYWPGTSQGVPGVQQARSIKAGED